MATINVAIVSLASLDVPVGTTVSVVQFTCAGTSDGNTTPQIQNVVAPPEGVTLNLAASFAVTVDDTYTLTAQAIDGNNVPLGTPASTSVQVSTAPALVTIQVPGQLEAKVA